MAHTFFFLAKVQKDWDSGLTVKEFKDKSALLLKEVRKLLGKPAILKRDKKFYIMKIRKKYYTFKFNQKSIMHL